MIKLNPELSGLVYSAYLGGATHDSCSGIAIDSEGNAYVTGSTRSSDFATTPGAYDTTHNGGLSDAFVTKLNAAGSVLIYSTFLGGSAGDNGNSIAVDDEGNAYATGLTDSTDFPTTSGGYDTTYNGDADGFVTKLNANGSGLVYSTLVGGGSFDVGEAIAIDGEGNAYITGIAGVGFPTTPGAFDTTHSGWSDVFVAKLNADGSALLYSTFLGGGSWIDYGMGIAIDDEGNAYVTGTTCSTDFPTTPGAFDTTHNGHNDGFVTKLDADGSALVYSTFLGGGSEDNPSGSSIAIDGSGNAYVTGDTGSSDFPTTPGAFDTTHNGLSDGFVTKLNPDGSALIYSTFLGGDTWDQGASMAIDGSGNAYVTGGTHSSDFPTTPGAYDTTYNGGDVGGDVFVCKMQFAAPSAVGRDRWREYE